MEENLISKKELLELTGISYGQLYRWKRKQLIPEEWFIKKSAFTGQETFFPKDKVLQRIDRIVNMKEDLSLDDIAGQVTSVPADFTITKEELLSRGLVSPVTYNYFSEKYGEPFSLNFETVLIMFIADKKLSSGEINLDEAGIVLSTLKHDLPGFEGKNAELIFCRKFGVAVCVLVQAGSKIHFDTSTKVIFKLNIESAIEELKLK